MSKEGRLLVLCSAIVTPIITIYSLDSEAQSVPPQSNNVRDAGVWLLASVRGSDKAQQYDADHFGNQTDSDPPWNSSVNVGNRLRLNLYGEVFDVTDFAKSHPGGAEILYRVSQMNLPDATALFESYHVMRNASEMRSKLAPFSTGEPAMQLYSFSENGLYQDLRRRVQSFLRTEFGDYSPKLKAPKGDWWAVAKIILFTTTLLYMLWLAVSAKRTHNAILICFCAGNAFFMTMGFEIMHSASHFSVSRSSSTNQLLDSISHALLYWDADQWRSHHVLHHHVYTGSAALDPDTTHLYPFVRKTLHHPWDPEWSPLLPIWLQMFQTTLFPGLYVLQAVQYVANALVPVTHTPDVLLDHVSGKEFQRRDVWALPATVQHGPYAFERSWWQHILQLWFPVWIILLIVKKGSRKFMHHSMHVIVSALAFLAAANFSYSMNVLPDHDTLASSIAARELIGSAPDWGELQVRNSANWGGSVTCFLFGGINYQIEHHLFPSLYPDYYPQIAPIVRDACHEHGIPYNHFPSLVAAVASVVANLQEIREQTCGSSSCQGWRWLPWIFEE
eukprot:gnl/MRDRNA2_/MRDRNA2_86485_c0_seq7.p1 gnl/MRDRNA2_/MRDRNA2_86485_c0~~gnl/MRDRNA2_/MRDRNA2_86485_c0_seq7.p1  ORF type:complete len:560 (-),score=70.10 gnl/MRDRNA2_/MRDRNA2_86485_c0_seq7:394-2073(-)